VKLAVMAECTIDDSLYTFWFCVVEGSLVCILRYRDESGSYHTHDSDGSGRVDSDITDDVVMQTPVLRDPI